MALRATYIASDNTATNGTALGVADEDVLVKAIVFGLGADSVYATIYNETNPFTGATTNIAAKVTQPAAAAGKNYDRTVTFGDGLLLTSGGNVVTNASQVTVIWDDRSGV